MSALLGFLLFAIIITVTVMITKKLIKYIKRKIFQFKKEVSQFKEEAGCINISQKNNKSITSNISIEKNTDLHELRSSKANRVNFLTDIAIQGKIIQVLESISVLQTTKNIDTLIGRIEFIFKIYEDLLIGSTQNTYRNNINNAVEKYKTNYYDKAITDVQLLLITSPNIDNLKELIAECIVTSYSAFVDVQKEEMYKLKTATAKEKRRESIIRTGWRVKRIYEEFGIIDNGHSDIIENIRRQYYS